jgi:hypothetical protein
VWNANGGIPEGTGPQAGRRAATPADFFGTAEPVDRTVDSEEDPFPRTHGDDRDTGKPATDADQLRGAFAMFAGPINDAVRRKAAQVDPGTPPDDPDAN